MHATVFILAGTSISLLYFHSSHPNIIAFTVIWIQLNGVCVFKR